MGGALATEVDKPVVPLIPNESNRLPNELSSAIRDEPKSSSPILVVLAFIVVGGAGSEGGGVLWGGAC